MRIIIKHITPEKKIALSVITGISDSEHHILTTSWLPLLDSLLSSPSSSSSSSSSAAATAGNWICRTWKWRTNALWLLTAPFLENKLSLLSLLFYFFIHIGLRSVRIKTYTLCHYSRACALYGLRFRSFADNDSLFALLFNFSFNLVLFVLKHT